MKRKALIMDETAVRRAMARITHEVIERNRGVESVCLLGVKRRGIPLARMLAENIEKFDIVRVILPTVNGKRMVKRRKIDGYFSPLFRHV